MYLAFDTETTDLPRDHLGLDHPFQPHLLQFAGIVFDKDGYEIDRLVTLVNPGPGVMVSVGAYNAHGISIERATADGMDRREVFDWFTGWANRVDVVIGHNVQFDARIIAILGARLTGERWQSPAPLYCTMTKAAPCVNLRPTAKMVAAGRNHPKPPTLSECVAHFFGEVLLGAHDAGADVEACIKVFGYLLKADI